MLTLAAILIAVLIPPYVILVNYQLETMVDSRLKTILIWYGYAVFLVVTVSTYAIESARSG